MITNDVVTFEQPGPEEVNAMPFHHASSFRRVVVKSV